MPPAVSHHGCWGSLVLLLSCSPGSSCCSPAVVENQLLTHSKGHWGVKTTNLFYFIYIPYISSLISWCLQMLLRAASASCADRKEIRTIPLVLSSPLSVTSSIFLYPYFVYCVFLMFIAGVAMLWNILSLSSSKGTQS